MGLINRPSICASFTDTPVNAAIGSPFLIVAEGWEWFHAILTGHISFPCTLVSLSDRSIFWTQGLEHKLDMSTALP